LYGKVGRLQSGTKQFISRAIAVILSRRRRSAIEPAIEHMKADGVLDRN